MLSSLSKTIVVDWLSVAKKISPRRARPRFEWKCINELNGSGRDVFFRLLFKVLKPLGPKCNCFSITLILIEMIGPPLAVHVSHNDDACVLLLCDITCLKNKDASQFICIVIRTWERNKNEKSAGFWHLAVL